MKTRPGFKFICDANPGDRLVVMNDKCVIVNKDFPPRIVEDGVVREMNYSEIDAALCENMDLKVPPR